MENSEKFDHNEFIKYLFKSLPFMPPLGKPRGLIDTFSPRNPVPFDLL